MPRSTTRAQTRPDLRRWLLAGITVGVASLAWTTLALAQEVSHAAPDAGRAGSSQPHGTVLPTRAGITVITSAPELPAAEIATPSATRVTSATSATGPRPQVPGVRYAPRGDQPTRALALDDENRAENPGLRRNMALMAVGVGAIIIGSQVDGGAGTILVLGGSGLSLYGLYQILR